MIDLEAIDRMLAEFAQADIVFVESGGEKIPRKGGPGITNTTRS